MKRTWATLLRRGGMYIFRPSAAPASMLSVPLIRRFTRLDRATARMAKLVDAWDLKSPARKGVPVRFRLRAPYKTKGCVRYLKQPFLFALSLPSGVEGSHNRRLNASSISRMPFFICNCAIVSSGYQRQSLISFCGLAAPMSLTEASNT